MSVDTLEFQLPQDWASAAEACREGAGACKFRVLGAESSDDRLVAVHWTWVTSPLRVEIVLSPAIPDGTRVAIKGRLVGFGPITKLQLRHHLAALRESIQSVPPVVLPPPPAYVRIADYVGNFAGDADVAHGLRENVLAPALRAGERLVVDFEGVEFSTPSFVHTLVSDLVRSPDFAALELLDFQNCAPSVRERIETVVEHSLGGAPEP